MSKSEQIKQRLNTRRRKLVAWWKAKLVERLSDIVTIDGCEFNINHPAVSTDAKTYFLFGKYEKPERKAIKKFLDPNLPVVEFGGAIGVVSCLTNKRLTTAEGHVVVEANPNLLSLLEENRDRNNCQFKILHRAVAYGCDEVSFNLNPNYLGSTAYAPVGETVRVTAVNLREIIEMYGFERCSLICDIEGGEADLVQYEADTLSRKVEALIVEVHPWAIGAEAVKNTLLKLKQIGFSSVYQKSNTYVFQNDSM